MVDYSRYEDCISIGNGEDVEQVGHRMVDSGIFLESPSSSRYIVATSERGALDYPLAYLQ